MLGFGRDLYCTESRSVAGSCERGYELSCHETREFLASQEDLLHGMFICRICTTAAAISLSNSLMLFDENY
jgi:hypothetical protein